MSLTVKCLILSLLFSAPHAFAGDDLNKCTQSSQQNAKDCKAAADGANGANNAQAGAAGNDANARGNTINPNAGSLAQVTNDGKQRLQQASQRCQQDKQKCDDDCKAAKDSADAKYKAGMAKDQCKTPPCPIAKSDKDQIPGEQQKECDGAIMPIIAMLDSGAAGNGSGNQQSNNTGGQSGAMPPIPPIPPPSPSNDQAATSSQVGTGTLSPVSTACTDSDPTSATNSTCQDTMLAQCGPGGSMVNAANSPCGAFTANYCNAVQGTQFPTAQPPSGAIRPGSGVGSQYCQNAVAGTFCQDPTHANCATCQSYRGLSVDPTLAASCPTVEPPLANNPVTAPTTGTGDLMYGGSGSSGGSGGGGLPSTSQANLPATKEGADKAHSALAGMNMAVSEGGGSGYSGGGESGDHDYSLGKFPGFKLGGASAKPSAALAAASRNPASAEVAAVNSPSLFNISSAAIQNMCSHNKLKHCGNN